MKIAGVGAATPKQKAWSWSYTKLKNYKVCPRKHYEVDIAKTFTEPADNDHDSALNWGKRLHDAFAANLKLAVPTALPPEFAQYQHWMDRVRAGPGKMYVEQKYAINNQFEARSWFADDVWVRMIGDVVKIDDPFTDRHGNRFRLALVLDWKTGKILEDVVQLMLMAQALFSHFPDLTHVRSEFVWLKDDCTTPELFTREEVARHWQDLIVDVNTMEKAHLTQNYPPKPGYLCRKNKSGKMMCPVSSCPFWGKGA